MQRTRVVVVGAGVVGLSTAVCIAEALPYCSVTVLAERFTPDTTSDIAAGIVMGGVPFPDIPLQQQHRWFKNTFDHLLEIARSQQASEAGVFLSSGWQIFQEVPDERRPFWADDVLGFRYMTDAELKAFPQYKFGQAFTTVKCECPFYLPWLEKRFKRAGGLMKKGRVTDLQELCHNYDLVVNCSGLEARVLVGDSAVHPIRGQILRVHAPWLKHFIRVGDGHTYIYPGRDSVTVGGTRQVGNWKLVADAGESEAILDRCCRLEPSLREAVCLGELVGLRPGRASPRLERGLLETAGGRRVPVVHNYGHGGWGVSLSWGTALEALKLVRESLIELPPPSRL
ncbi:D-aspartate oxidase isoform X2 [Conger conger]|nr:D-aspartate oxidase isoform X2 [Conger conger]XP_061100992.1 D-aspartate oxidase isoform X2 [Conger conger]XP_061101000.1 D-aspartate oxidase isoform X2 [Conger conger]